MEIEQHAKGSEGAFYLKENGKRIGEMKYTMTDDQTMDIYHTQVNEQHQGQHLGEKLIEAGVQYAREKHLKVSPSCTFAKAIFARNKDYRDILA